MSYEELIIEAEKEGIDVYENNYIGKLKGLYVDNTITINTNIETEAEKRCIIAEEMGHYHTNCGNLLDQSKLENRKQEKIARAWAYKRLVGVISLVNAYNHGCRNRYELAEYLQVTEEFIEETLEYYKQKHGLYVHIDNYIVYFEPLSVLEIWK